MKYFQIEIDFQIKTWFCQKFETYDNMQAFNILVERYEHVLVLNGKVLIKTWENLARFFQKI